MFLSIAFCVLFSQLLSVFWNNKQLFANEHKKHLLSSKAKKRNKKMEKLLEKTLHCFIARDKRIFFQCKIFERKTKLSHLHSIYVLRQTNESRIFDILQHNEHGLPCSYLLHLSGTKSFSSSSRSNSSRK